MRNPIVYLKAYWKIALVVLGIVLAVLSWFTDHAEPGDLIANIFAPKYAPTLNAYKQMLDNGTELRATDTGFSEIIAILSEVLTGPVNSIVSIKTHGDSQLLFYGKEFGSTITLELTLTDGQSVTLGPVNDLEPAIQKRFLETVLVQTSKFIMLVSIIIALTTTLPDYWRDAHASSDQAHKMG